MASPETVQSPLLSPADRRHLLKAIFEAGVQAADPGSRIRELLARKKDTLHLPLPHPPIDLARFQRVRVLGAGKATAKMAQAIEDILGERLSDGLIAVKYGHGQPLNRIRTIEAGHPLPDENGVAAARAMAELAEGADEKTLVVLLISGGGSALLPFPYADESIRLDLGDKQETTRLLLGCGAAIHEINCLRKHLSGIKGGRLAKQLYPGRSLALILSDVVGDDLDAIASGPTAPDPSTFADMAAIIQSYGIENKLPPAVGRILEKGLSGEIAETPKPGDPAFDNIRHLLIGTNFLSLQAAAQKARTLGFHPWIISSRITGEAREIAKAIWGIAQDGDQQGLYGKKPLCLIFGGETTVSLRGSGKGGRNQEMALAMLAEMEKAPDAARFIAFLSGATDGGDGPTDAAGAFADVELLQRASAKNLAIRRYLAANDAYHFFEPINGLLKTGPTGTNVCDIQLVLVG